MIVMVVPFVIGMYICPESPRWLYSKGKTYTMSFLIQHLSLIMDYWLNR